MSRLEIPQPALGHPRPNPSRSTNSSYLRTSGNPFERSISSERPPSRPVSTYTEFTPRGRPTYQPRRASHLRYSNSHTGDHADALATLEGRQLASKTGSKSSHGKHWILKPWQPLAREYLGHRPLSIESVTKALPESAEYEVSGQRASDDSWSGSSGESHRPHVGLPQNQNRLQSTPMKPAVPRYQSSDLDSLASHRKSHAAETGQLLPRVRVNDATGEWTAVQQPAEHRNFLSERSATRSSSDPFATPQTTPFITPMKEPSRGPPSFEEFVRSTSPQGQYYLGEEGIPLQEQPGDSHGGAAYGASATHQQQARKQDVTGGKASSFSEAV
ncbi:MAG: hypothetical protein Q9201_002447 [Fulgogasparrea decipioides]